MKLSKLELSIAIGLAVMLLCCAAETQPVLHWWSAAFSPLCDGVLTGDAAGGIVVKSRLLELLRQLRGLL